MIASARIAGSRQESWYSRQTSRRPAAASPRRSPAAENAAPALGGSSVEVIGGASRFLLHDVHVGIIHRGLGEIALRVGHLLADGSHLHPGGGAEYADRKSTRLNSSHQKISYAVFC